MPRRKIARVGDVVSWDSGGRRMKGVVHKVSSEFLFVRLEEAREPRWHETELGIPYDLYEDTIYKRNTGNYTIEEFAK